MFDQWRFKLKEAALKAAEQLNFDEMARNDEYIHQEGLKVVRKDEKNNAARVLSQEIDQPSSLPNFEGRTQESLLKLTKVLPSSAHTIASSTRSVTSMRQHSSLGSSVYSDSDEEAPKRVGNDNTSEDESENVVRKNKLRFLEDLDHRLSKPNQELELMPQYTKTNTATASSVSESVSTGSALWSSPQRNSNKKQPLWAKTARSQPQNKPDEGMEPLIVTTTTSSAVLDDSEMQALAALQQQSSASSSASLVFLFMPSVVMSWCSGIVPSLRQYPKVTCLVFLIFLFYLLRVYSRLAVPVEGGASSLLSP
ncbi:hypothetical protein FisN_4Hh323 [Fistulifera solaris]|uniref:Uncharacterized protein n=1 Tax=Fistulifera solaris TaxID=1519565 RepID=A0A1Z5KF61_FISSO|nr:hypothetical protein FisN_4Hh323 [Fistulifera solaris]|eukprot:GAX24765.1 hypothetical protein FisN_4Hh323 [Fistulifera solaris]